LFASQWPCHLGSKSLKGKLLRCSAMICLFEWAGVYRHYGGDAAGFCSVLWGLR
jgi:hypothetical protein